ncbi:MAG TPA: SpoIVB peptidase S55 domain-containing protein [Selenomonadales bacterium]|nr:SpoIVB peptidase S55 domain-containing protein [Selenomonadales bacterium]
MSRILSCCRVTLCVAFLMLPAALGLAAPAIMPVDEVKTGMQGIAKTVVAGTKIDEFGVEVLGVMKNKGPSGDLILVRTYGDVIDRTGGIAQGMSGSPVYIDGKLVGAIAYGWPFADHKVGMVTPIADMLKLWDNAGQDHAQAPVQEAEETDASEDGGAVTESTPLMASGFGEQTLAMLTDKLRPFKLVPYAVGEAPDAANYAPLEPGSAVGVQLVRGDVSLGALGTVTYVENNKVLAFGHPFLKKGPSNYFMTSAYVFTTVSGLESSFKVGTTGQAVGMINQDRGAGIAGEVDRFPGIIPLRIIIEDKNQGVAKDMEAQVIQDEQLSPILATAAVANAIEKTTDRIGPGTARVSFELSARNMPGEVFKRDNLFYSPGQIGEQAVSEFYELMALLASNQFQAVDIMDVKVNVTIDSERRTASIMEARPSTTVAKPGDTIDITVTLKPYRGETITRKVPFTIPKEQPAGPLTLEIRGGGTVPLTQLLMGKQQGGEGEVLKQLLYKLKTRTFTDMLKEMADRDRNNDIVVEVLDINLGELPGKPPKTGSVRPGAAPKPNPGADKKARQPLGMGGDKNVAQVNKGRISTDYIIDSDTQVLVNVEKPK